MDVVGVRPPRLDVRRARLRPDPAVGQPVADEREHQERDHVRDHVVDPEPGGEEHEQGAAQRERDVVHQEEHGHARAATPPVVPAREHPRLGEAEVPQRGPLRRDHRRDHVEEADHVGEEREQHGVDHEAGEAHDPEAGESQPCQQAEVAHRLPGRGLAAAGAPLPELERDLGRAQAGMPDEDLEQDLEAARPQRVEVERLAPHQEEAAHRVADASEAARERHVRRGGGGPRRHRPHPPEAPGVAVVAVPARHHDVEVARLALLEQRGDQLRRVLEVGVHDADPRAARLAHALKDCRAEPADPPLRRLRNQDELVMPVLRERIDQLASPVVAVVDEDDLDRDGGKRGLEPLDQCGYVVAFVLGRDDDRQKRNCSLVEDLWRRLRSDERDGGLHHTRLIR